MITAADVRAVALPLPRTEEHLIHDWVHARMAALDPDEMRELIIDAWRMVVPKKVAAAHLGIDR
jgi:hypothetical protein